MHYRQDGRVLDARLTLYVSDAHFVERVQVNQMDALCDAILFHCVKLIIFYLSEHLEVRSRSQLLQVALSLDEVIELF